jgi:CRISPR/Cas system-associated exonuclease Cas4 (RecB family)
MIKEGKDLNDVVCTAYRMGCEQTREVYQKRIEKLEAALREVLSLGDWGVNILARTIILEVLETTDGSLGEKK